MNQLDRIEAKLTRLLEIAESLLLNDNGKAPQSLGAETAEPFNSLKGGASLEELHSMKTEFVLIDAEQNIQALFTKYPAFKEDFFRLDEELEGLKGPMGMGMLKESTLGMIAKSLRIDVDGFVSKVTGVIAGYK